MNKCPGIVISEDDDDIREQIQEILQMEGYSVTSYPNGKIALDSLNHTEQPCLILLDIMMPVMDGWEFLKKWLDSGHSIAAIPVYVMSAAADVSKARQAGALGYIKKPVNLDALIATVEEHCRRVGESQ